MRLLLAIFIPWVSFFTIKRPFSAIFCFFLQISLVFWIPAVIWAVYSVGQYKTDKKIENKFKDAVKHHELTVQENQA